MSGSQARRRPAKVAHVYVSLPVGGAEHHLLNILAGIDRSRFAPSVVCLGEAGAIGERIRASGESFRAFGFPSKRLWIPWLLRRVAVFFRAEAFDIVHAHMHHAGVYGRLAAWWGGVPHLVWTIHTNVARPRRKHRLTYRLLDRITERTIVVSGDIFRAQVALGDLAPERMEVICNGVDVERYASANPAPATRAAIGVPGDALIVCIVARIESEKRHCDLVDAFRAVKARVPRAHLLIVGGGRLESAVRSQVSAAGLGGAVTLTGPRTDIPDLLHASDVFALASDREGMPLAVVEAMASGLPVVASNVGGVPEAVGSEAGLLFAPRDVAALAGALERCLRDEALRRGMGGAGRQRALAQFSMPEMVRRIESVYEGCLETRPVRGYR